jgi:hypothetical protein
LAVVVPGLVADATDRNAVGGRFDPAAHIRFLVTNECHLRHGTGVEHDRLATEKQRRLDQVPSPQQVESRPDIRLPRMVEAVGALLHLEKRSDIANAKAQHQAAPDVELHAGIDSDGAGALIAQDFLREVERPAPPPPIGELHGAPTFEHVRIRSLVSTDQLTVHAGLDGARVQGAHPDTERDEIRGKHHRRADHLGLREPLLPRHNEGIGTLASEAGSVIPDR